MKVKEGDVKFIFKALYMGIGAIVMIIYFNDFSESNGFLTNITVGWIISLVKGMLWPIFIWFLF